MFMLKRFKFSDETREKIRIAATGRVENEEECLTQTT